MAAEANTERERERERERETENDRRAHRSRALDANLQRVADPHVASATEDGASSRRSRQKRPEPKPCPAPRIPWRPAEQHS
jgi:hypothetical protein